MAKPGSGDAKQLAELAKMSRLAHDLSAGKLPEGYAVQMVVEAEARLGFRCAGCGARVTTGFQFTRVSPVNEGGRPTVDVQQLTACNGENGCGFALEVKNSDPPPTLMEMVEYVWLSADPKPLADKLAKSSPEAAGNGAAASVAASPSAPAPSGETAEASGDESAKKVELPPERRTRSTETPRDPLGGGPDLG